MTFLKHTIHPRGKRTHFCLGSSVFLALTMLSPLANAFSDAPPSLKEIEVPSVGSEDQIKDFVADEKKARRLGKALFWDMQAGSDGQACGSCHFSAGADLRVKNQLAPGLNRGKDKVGGNPDTSFQTTASGGAGGPNYTLVPGDFPFHQFANPDNRYSGVIFSSNDVASSQGTFGGNFVEVPSGTELIDECDRFADQNFHVAGIGVRKSEPRHTPTVINSIFNFRNFWDGRANNVFNGVDPFGLRNSNAHIYKKDGSTQMVDLRNSSVASQGVGPPGSDFEMICTGRAFAKMAQKLIPKKALAFQKVHKDDSMLGGERDDKTGRGLKKNYETMIQEAFKSDYWDSSGEFDGYTLMERNFSLFWGISLQMYQATLVSDKAPYDEFADGKKEPFDIKEGKKDKLSKAEYRGLEVFLGKGKCINCHKGAEFSGAASVLQSENEENGLVERMVMGNGGVALYDTGFYNIGVTPTHEDIGVGGNDPFGNPLSFTKQFVNDDFVDPIEVDPCTFEKPFNKKRCHKVPSDLSNEKLAVKGAFKVPILRNVELTGPYMHNGSMATLEQVVEFYNRGGNFADNPELAPDIQPLGLSHGEKSDLVAFMKALTDPRVRNEKAPFDHPQLFIPNGHPGDEYNVSSSDSIAPGVLADDAFIVIPAVGKDGRSKEGLPPLKPFMEGSLGVLGSPPDLGGDDPVDGGDDPVDGGDDPVDGGDDPDDGDDDSKSVTGTSKFDLRDDKKVKWKLVNSGSKDVFITRVTVVWPSEHGKLKKFKLNGDFAKDVFDRQSPTEVPMDRRFESDPNKRKLQGNSDKKLEIEFTDKFKGHKQSDFSITVEFDNGQTITLSPE